MCLSLEPDRDRWLRPTSFVARVRTMRALDVPLLLLAIATPTHGLSHPPTNRRAALFAAAAASSVSVLPVLPVAAKDRVSGYPKQYDWDKTLASGPNFVLRQGGTEPPNSSPLVKEKRAGVFVCVGCKTPLFESAAKFESGTGWPSYASGLEGVETVESLTGGLLGKELRCAGCGGHLGDVFNDGKVFRGTPAEVSGKRFCIDGAALVFQPADGGESVSGDGLTKRRYSAPKEVELPAWLQPPKVS